MAGKKYVTDHDFYCTRCGKKGIPICRKGRMREAGHLKRLYCLHCDEVVNHAECVEGTKYDRWVFAKEFADGNFGRDGMRIKSLSEWQAGIKSGYKEKKEEDINVEEWMLLFGMM